MHPHGVHSDSDPCEDNGFLFSISFTSLYSDFVKSRLVNCRSLSIHPASDFLLSTSAATGGIQIVPFFFFLCCWSSSALVAFKFSSRYSITLVFCWIYISRDVTRQSLWVAVIQECTCELTGWWPSDVFISLNAVRVISIIALLLVFSSSILVMVDDIEAVNVFTNGGSNSTINSAYIQWVFEVCVIANVLNILVRNSTVPNQPGGVFWAVLNRLLIMAQTVVLILSELGKTLATMYEYASSQPLKAGPSHSLILTSPFSGATLG